MFSLRCTIFAMGCVLMQSALHAKTIKIDGDAPRDRITVTIQNTKIGSVLENFGVTYGFEVKGLKYIKTSDYLTTTVSGSLETILGRLLRNWNYMIVRSPDNRSGIRKLMILDSSYGSGSSKRRRAKAPAEFPGSMQSQLSSNATSLILP